MPLVKHNPQQFTVHQGHTVFATHLDGQIHSTEDGGLYFRDTRVISRWQLRANDANWLLLSSAKVTYNAGRIYLTNSEISTEEGKIQKRKLGLALSRSADGGIHEDIDITN